jgi:hypothetical protein
MLQFAALRFTYPFSFADFKHIQITQNIIFFLTDIGSKCSFSNLAEQTCGWIVDGFAMKKWKGGELFKKIFYPIFGKKFAYLRSSEWHTQEICDLRINSKKIAVGDSRTGTSKKFISDLRLKKLRVHLFRQVESH